MATLSHIGIPGVGNGILHPKMKNRFRVLFYEVDGTQIEVDVSLQVLSTTAIVQSKASMKDFGINIQESFGLTVEDDITGLACSGLQRLMDRTEPFTIKIEHLDGNVGVVRTYTFGGCQIEQILHDSLDYSGGGVPSARYDLRIPAVVGNLVENLGDEAKALYAVLNGSSLTYSPPERGCQTLKKDVTILYTSLSIS